MKGEKKILKGIILFFAGMMVLGMVSRAADSVTVPKVQVQSPSRDSLTFQVSGEGKITAEKEKVVFLPEGGKLVSFAAVGQQVKKGDTIASFDVEDLKKKREACKAEIEKQELAIQQETLSGTPSAQTREQDAAERTVSQTSEKLQAAKEERNRLQNEYDALLKKQEAAKQKAKQETAGNQETVKEQEDTQQQEMVRNQETAKEQTDSREQETTQKQETQKQETPQEQSNIQQQDLAYEEEKNELKAQIQAAQDKVDSLEDSLQSARDALSDAKKNDANTEENNEKQKNLSELSIESMQIDLKQKNEELEQIEALLSKSGKVEASEEGIVMEASLTTGAQTTGQEYLVIGSGNESFTADVERKAAAYLSEKDEVTFTMKGSQEPLKGTIEKIQNNAEDSRENSDAEQDSGNSDEKVRILVKLEKNNLPIGTALEFKITKESETNYDTIIPIAALREDNQGKYVLILRQEETVLGTEWIASRVKVTLLDQDDSKAAVESALLSDDQIIIGSNKSIQEGDRVRVE